MLKKAIIIGCSGSGKSFFARALAEKTGIPLCHLDLIWWREDGTNIEREEFDGRLSEILSQDEWLIDGNYQRTMERRMQACDTVFFFDIPLEDRIAGIKERKGKPRVDIAWQSPLEDEDEEFMSFVKAYNENNRPRVIELLEKYSDKNIIIFKSRGEADDYLNNI